MVKQNNKHYIREWRKFRRLTQVTLAERLEIEPGEQLMSHATLSNIERNAQSPTLEQIYAIAAALNTTAACLIEVNPSINPEIIDIMKYINGESGEKAVAILKAALG